MFKKTAFLLFICLALFVLIISACNMPSTKKPVQESPGLIHTIAAQTVEAQLTLDAELRGEGTPTQDFPEGWQPTLTPTQTEMLPPTETLPPPPTNTSQPPATITSIPCDHMTFVKDVTIPDGTKMVPGQSFTKTWRLKNSGTCTWTSSYSLVFVSGEAMDAPAASQLTTNTIAPGQEYDVSVNLQAPDTPGTYRANFKLRNAAGTIFGTGDKSSSFFVEIVVETTTGVMFDFIARADDAIWGSGTGTITYTLPGDILLPYDTSIPGTDAYVTTQKGVRLEDGSTSAVILETHPDNNGYIIGRYPAYLVAAGDYIKARIGFLAEVDGKCGAGNVVFQINYTIGDDLASMTKLGSWNETCDKSFRKISLDLSSLKGKTVRFYIIVTSNGVSTDDKAIWDSLGVFR